TPAVMSGSLVDQSRSSSGPRQRSRGWLPSVFLAAVLVGILISLGIGWYKAGHAGVPDPKEKTSSTKLESNAHTGGMNPKQSEKPEAHRIGIGFRARAFSERYLRATGLPDIGSCIEVTGVFPGGAADRAGVKSGDVIRKVDSQLIHDFDELVVAIGKH